MKYYVAMRDSYDYFNKFAVVKSELLTEKERSTKARYIADSVFQIMEINRSHTMRNFGVRLVKSAYREQYHVPRMF